jgi:hypothetical protein
MAGFLRIKTFKVIFMSDNGIRISSDDLIPRLENAGIAAIISQYAKKSIPQDVLLWLVNDYIAEKIGITLTWEQLLFAMADLVSAGYLVAPQMFGTSLPTPSGRVQAVGLTGVSNTSVWFSEYEGIAWGAGDPLADPPVEPHDTGTFRFYVNGVLKTTLTDYYIADLATIGATTGDKVQMCEVKDGLVGWFAEVTVP